MTNSSRTIILLFLILVGISSIVSAADNWQFVGDYIFEGYKHYYYLDINSIEKGNSIFRVWIWDALDRPEKETGAQYFMPKYEYDTQNLLYRKLETHLYTPNKNLVHADYTIGEWKSIARKNPIGDIYYFALIYVSN